MSKRIVYHVKKSRDYFFFTKTQLNSTINEMISQFKGNVIIKDLSENDIIEYVLTTANNKLQSSTMPYSHTLAFEYDDDINVLFVSWAKQHLNDTFSRKRGYKMANSRLDRLIAYNCSEKKEYGREFSDTPVKIEKSIKEYLPKVKKYFKNIKEDFELVVY